MNSGSTTPQPSTPVIDLAQWKASRQKRQYTPRGAVYRRMDRQEWQAQYDLARTMAVIRSFPNRQQVAKGMHYLTGQERVLLLTIARWRAMGGMRRTANIAQIAHEANVNKRTAHRILTRLGQAHILVNVVSAKRGRAIDLAPNPRLAEWDFAALQAFRKVYSAEVRDQLRDR